MQLNRPEISVVILCYRAEDLVPKFVARVKEILDNRGLDYELVLVGNYLASMKDADRTPQIIRELARNDSRLHAVVKEKRGMMGWDMRSGLDAATGKLLAIIDGDGQMPPEDVVRVYDKFKSGNYDIVKTYRRSRQDSFQRVLLSKVYNLFIKILFPKAKVKDVNSKPKIFTKEVLKKLQLTSDDWFIDGEMMIRASYLKMSIGEIPTDFYVNQYRTSFVRTSTIFEFLSNLFSYRIKLFFLKIKQFK